jgi:hypothetical protein
LRTKVKRGLLKSVLFAALIAVVLNPDLKRGILQLKHTLHPESLIQTDFPGLRSINPQIDRLIAADGGSHSEARLVARFVVNKIKYVTDYENWSNVEYWPTAQEAWRKRQEDCDGRAILATSILRARGYHSARMVIGLDHMWIKVNENEKNPSKPPHLVALLSPNRNFSMELRESSRWEDFRELIQALLHPSDLIDALTQIFADIPPLRKVILITSLLGLCYHPCKQLTGFLAVLAAGLAAANLLANWEPGTGHALQGICGATLLLGAITAALLMGLLLNRQPASPAPAYLLPESA